MYEAATKTEGLVDIVRNRQNCRGFISPMILMIIVALEIVLGGIGYVFMMELKNEQVNALGIQTYYLAEYGYQIALERLQNDDEFCNVTIVSKQRSEPDMVSAEPLLYSGKYEIYIYGDYDKKHILSVGSINDVKSDFEAWVIRNQQTGMFEVEEK